MVDPQSGTAHPAVRHAHAGGPRVVRVDADHRDADRRHLGCERSGLPARRHAERAGDGNHSQSGRCGRFAARRAQGRVDRDRRTVVDRDRVRPGGRHRSCDERCPQCGGIDPPEPAGDRARAHRAARRRQRPACRHLYRRSTGNAGRGTELVRRRHGRARTDVDQGRLPGRAQRRKRSGNRDRAGIPRVSLRWGSPPPISVVNCPRRTRIIPAEG